MRESGKMIKDKVSEDKFGLIDPRFKGSGAMERCRKGYLPGLMGVIIRGNSLKM